MTDPTVNPPLLVLDTNVVLDWLYFADPSCESLAMAIRKGQVRWIATLAMRDEIEHVLARGIRERRLVDSAAVLDAWDQWAFMTTTEPDDPLPAALRCTDADDQKFIDLALRVGATALLTRDRAVLKLARRARTHGLRIQPAHAWQPQGFEDRSR